MKPDEPGSSPFPLREGAGGRFCPLVVGAAEPEPLYCGYGSSAPATTFRVTRLRSLGNEGEGVPIHYGDIGRALTTLSPSGAVDVLGERIDARSDGTVIEAGSFVVVLRGDPTGYVVQKLNPGQTPPKVRNHGKPIRRADFQLTRSEASAAERREQAEAQKRRREGHRSGRRIAGAGGAVAGLACGAIGWVLGWVGGDDPAGVVVLMSLLPVGGAMAGVVLFLLLSLVSSTTGGADG